MDPDNDDVLTDSDIFNDCSKTIGDALQAVHKENNTRVNLAETAFTISLNKLVWFLIGLFLSALMITLVLISNA